MTKKHAIEEKSVGTKITNFVSKSFYNIHLVMLTCSRSNNLIDFVCFLDHPFNKVKIDTYRNQIINPASPLLAREKKTKAFKQKIQL